MTQSKNDDLIVKYVSVSVFAIFIGSQITEGVLLVPYWQSLSAGEFYSYYLKFGPSIGRFYTVLTITAALIPLAVAIIYSRKKHIGFKYALLSSFFAVLFIACFYIYFKGVNGNFYQSYYSEADLAKELITWNRWHWSRIGIEIVSLCLLMMAFNSKRGTKEGE